MNLLHEFFNSRSDANKYLAAEQQEELENDFNKWLYSHPHPISEERMKAIVTEITGMENEHDVPFKLFQAVGSNTNCRIIYKKCLRAVELTLKELNKQ